MLKYQNKGAKTSRPSSATSTKKINIKPTGLMTARGGNYASVAMPLKSSKTKDRLKVKTKMPKTQRNTSSETLKLSKISK